jgi:hypothetical protein
MSKLFGWIKTHKLLTFNILVVAFVLFKLLTPTMIGSTRSTMVAPGSAGVYYDSGVSQGVANLAVSEKSTAYLYNEAAPQPDVIDRKVVENSVYSLLVKNVTETVDKIKEKTMQISGYSVSSDLSKKEFGDNAVLQIRVPSEKVDEMTKYLRTIAVKVVSEKVNGNDITDQYIDIERRITDLEKQRTKMETIMDSAKTVNEMLEVQRGLFQIQDQIDSYKGRLLYMDGTTKTSKLTIYLSTDELSLPYTPAQPWRPEVIFREAVRSMLGTLQKLAGLAIWLVVYSPVVIIAVLVVRLIKRRKKTQ